jgi:fluoride ion exporter CrcB/FEX
MLLALAVAVGGAAGALARYGLDRVIEHHVFTVRPWSTFVINVTGCFLAGVTIAALVDRHHLPGWVRARGSWSASLAPTRHSRRSGRRRATSSSRGTGCSR